ncbi:MAG: hypothetical protein LUD81_02515, partial [Clostridiales bacterium]|nr:hypothetical protein [Clostridiales bacterium]
LCFSYITIFEKFSCVYPGAVQTALTPTNRTTGFSPTAGTSHRVNLYNITLTFKAGNTVFNGDTAAAELTAYLRYGEAGLYTSDSYDKAFEIPSVMAEGSAYRLEDDSWLLYIDGTQQTGTLSAADLKVYTISDGKTYYTTPSLIESISVTIAPAEASQGTIYYENTAVETNTVKYFDSGITIKDVTDLIKFTPASGAYFSLAGWYVDDVLVTDYTAVLTDGQVLKPYITSDSYSWSENVTGDENISFATLTGAYNNVVTYGTDITFSLKTEKGYKVYSVYYTIGAGTAAELTAVNGVYTISGKDISDDVTLNVTIRQYHTITFEAGTGTEMKKITAYAWSGTAGLYNSVEGLGQSGCSLNEDDITGGVKALEDYDLATDTPGDGLWTTGGVVYTTEAVLATKFSADTAFTANASAINTAAYKAWVKVLDTDTIYNVGDTVNADIYISADSEANADKVKITFNEDWFTISDVSVNNNASYTNAGNVITAEGLNTTVATAGTAVISLKLTVNSDITTNEAAEITVDETNSFITPYGRTVEVKPTAGTAAQVSIYNLALTFKPGKAVFNGDSSITSLTAYMKYNETGLFSSNSYTTPFEIPAVTVENTAYRLNENSWVLYIDGEAQENTLTAEDLAVYTISNDKTYEVMPSVAEQITVTINPADSARGTIFYNGAAVEASITITFDSGVTLEYIANLIKFATADDTSYSLAGWYLNGSETPVLVSNYSTTAITADTALSPYITANRFSWSGSAENGSVGILTGVENSVITYGNDITFTLTPKDGYKVYSVYYTVEGNVPVQLTETNGVYTIPGKAVVNNISLDAAIKQYHTITFSAGTGSTMKAAATAYAWNGAAGLYSSADNLGESAYSLTASDIINGLTAESGYRLAADTVGDELWTENADGAPVYTTAAILEKAFTADTAFTANAVRQYKVTFEAGENGSISGTTEITADSGKSITYMGGTLPTPKANSNYVFAGWFINGAEASEADILTMEITGDLTVTAEFRESSYSITFTKTPSGTFSNISGVSEENGSYTAVYNTDVTFTFIPNEDYETAEIYFTVDGVKPRLNDNGSGSYTISGSDITGTVSVIVESNATRTFTITVNSESGGSLTGTTAFTLLLGRYLTEEQLNGLSVTAPTGYSFKGWRITAESNVYNSSLDSTESTASTEEKEIVKETVRETVIIDDDNLSGSAVEAEETIPEEESEEKPETETTSSVNVVLASLVSDRIYTSDELLTIEADRNITFEAVFELTDFSVIDENSAAVITDGADDSGNVHYGTNVSFTLTGDKIISYVGYKIGENGTETKLTADENGVFTIPGSVINDNVYIITTVVSGIEITFISHDDYLGEAVTAGEGRKIAVLSAALLDSGTYALTNGREFFYSEKIRRICNMGRRRHNRSRLKCRNNNQS